MNGIIIINKPKSFTSFDVIAVLRKALNQRKIGHMGTLDPMATGVLPILLGDSAKFQIYSNNHDKTYVADLKFGITTDTLDITGNILSETKSSVNREELQKVLKTFIGEIFQVPPMFSAIKIKGQKLCDLARKGVEIEREKRKITIYDINLIDFNEENQTAKIEVACSKGTYIRTLCDDIGQKLSVGAVLTELRRTKSNGFDISESISLDDIKFICERNGEKNFIFPTDMLFKDMSSVNVSELQANRLYNGASLDISRVRFNKKFIDQEILKVYMNNIFVGLAKVVEEKNELRALKCEHNFEF